MLLVVLFILLVALARAWQWHDAEFYVPYDGDVWMRYLRIFDLVETGNWHNNLFCRANYPHGDTVPWTRLFDLLILGPAWVLKTFSGFEWREAIFWSGSWISPCLHIVACFGLWRAGRLLGLPKHAAHLAVAGFAAHPLMQAVFRFGRGDHHSLFVCLYILSLGSFLRLLREPQSWRALLQLALLLIAGLWVGPEYLSVIFFCMACLGMLWLHDGAKWVAALWRLPAVLACLCLPLVLVEKSPSDFLVAEYDRISVLHVTLLGLAALMAGISLVLDRHLAAAFRRWLLAGAQCAVIFIVCNWLYPRFYLGPYAAFDERMLSFINAEWHEMWPLFRLPASIIASLIVLFVAGAFGLWVTAQKKENAPSLFFAALLMAGYAALTLVAYRWHYYAVPVMLLGAGLFASCLLEPLFLSGRAAARIAAAVMAAFLLFTVFIHPYDSSFIRNDRNDDANPRQACLLGLYYMLQHGGFGDDVDLDDKTVLAPTYVGSRLLYWTDARIIGSTYTRNVDGILDSWTFFSARDGEAVRRILAKRDVDYVLACPSGAFRSAADEGLARALALSYLEKTAYEPPAFPGFIHMTPSALPQLFRVTKEAL